MRLPRIASCLFLLCAGLAPAADEASDAIDRHLASLKSPDAETRIAAVRALQTSLDARIPEAMLPLLSDDGNSIRRLAARAIGSRWWQIPKANVPAYVKALKPKPDSEFGDETNMRQRAIGLLGRAYKGDMFSRSPSGKWVVYERRGLPCLIQTETDTEELIGWHPDGNPWLAAAWSNSEVATAARWHGKKDIVALSMILHRRASTFWIWRHDTADGPALRKFEPAEIARALGLGEDDLFYPGGFSADPSKWDGDTLRIEVFFSTQKDERFADHTAELGWDAVSGSLRVISHTTEEAP